MELRRRWNRQANPFSDSWRGSSSWIFSRLRWTSSTRLPPAAVSPRPAHRLRLATRRFPVPDPNSWQSSIADPAREETLACDGPIRPLPSRCGYAAKTRNRETNGQLRVTCLTRMQMSAKRPANPETNLSSTTCSLPRKATWLQSKAETAISTAVSPGAERNDSFRASRTASAHRGGTKRPGRPGSWSPEGY